MNSVSIVAVAKGGGAIRAPASCGGSSVGGALTSRGGGMATEALTPAQDARRPQRQSKPIAHLQPDVQWLTDSSAVMVHLGPTSALSFWKTF
jgi:hypothetical protein